MHGGKESTSSIHQLYAHVHACTYMCMCDIHIHTEYTQEASTSLLTLCQTMRTSSFCSTARLQSCVRWLQ